MPFFLGKKDFVARVWIPSPKLASHEAFCDHDHSFPTLPKSFGVDFQSFQTDPKESKKSIDCDEVTLARKKVLMLENANVVDARTPDAVAVMCPPWTHRAC